MSRPARVCFVSTVLLSLAAALAGCGDLAGDVSSYRVLRTEERVLTAEEIAGVTALRIFSGSGELSVLGDPDATEIRIEVVYRGAPTDDAGAAELLSRLGVSVRAGADGLEVATVDVVGGAVDLVLTVPPALDLWIADGSEDVDVLYIQGDVRIDDGSGDVRVAKVGGDLEVADGSGDVWVSEVMGAGTVLDGSGDIELLEVRGVVTVEDGSGNVDVSDAGDDVVVMDGSGEIGVSGVAGSVEITDGSGEIGVSGVAGSVEITDGSGDIRVRDVGGDLRVVDGSGEVEYSGVGGAVRL